MKSHPPLESSRPESRPVSCHISSDKNELRLPLKTKQNCLLSNFPFSLSRGSYLPPMSASPMSRSSLLDGNGQSVVPEPKKNSNQLRNRPLSFYGAILGFCAVVVVQCAIFLGFTCTTGGRAMQTSGFKQPDIQVFPLWNEQYFMKMAEAYGADGRDFLARFYVTFDIAYPLAYMTWLGCHLWYLAVDRERYSHYDYGWTKKEDNDAEDSINVERSVPILLRLQVILPILAGVCDFLENASIRSALLAYPTPATWCFRLGPLATMTKWVFLAISLLLILFHWLRGCARTGGGGGG